MNLDMDIRIHTNICLAEFPKGVWYGEGWVGGKVEQKGPHFLVKHLTLNRHNFGFL